MDIAALSTSMSTMNVSSDVSIAVLSKSLDTYKEMGDSMAKMMEQSVSQGIGQNIDVSV